MSRANSKRDIEIGNMPIETWEIRILGKLPVMLYAGRLIAGAAGYMQESLRLVL